LLTKLILNYIYVGFECLFSTNSNLTEYEELSFKRLVEFYSSDVECFDKSFFELKLWKRKCEKLPKSGLQALIMCDEQIYPNIFLLLKILCTLPVSTTSPERMFSTLKRVKTYLRNIIGQVIIIIFVNYIIIMNFY